MTTVLDSVCDALVAGRHTIRVGNAKPESEGKKTFFVSFLVSLDDEAYAALCAVADKHERSAPRFLRRYIKDCFRFYLAEEEESELDGFEKAEPESLPRVRHEVANGRTE
jgi:hypothetical protein